MRVKHLIFTLLIFLMVGCVTYVPKTDLLIRYPLKGEVIKVYREGSIHELHYFVVDYADLIHFLRLPPVAIREK